jgi:S-layer homology domain
MPARTSLSATLLIAAATAAAAQTPPMGPEIPVNTYTTGIQDVRAGAVAVDQGSGFGIVWESLGEDGDGYGVYGRAFFADGTPTGGQGRANTYTTGNQERAVVGADKNGDFVVAWESDGQDGSGYGIFAQRYANTGLPIGGEFQVNTYTTGSQSLPAVAMNRAGRFVVVWSGSGQDGDGEGVFGQIYDDNGGAIGGEFQVNTYTTGDQTRPAVAMNFTGDFVVVWESAGQDGDGLGVMARRYDAAGTPVGGEIPVNTFTTGDQKLASVGMDRLGNFVVAWDSAGSDGSGSGVSGRRFDSSGAPLTSEFPVNTFTPGFQGTPSLSMDRNGNFMVAWQSNQDGDAGGVIARAFDSSATATTPEFAVNVTTTGNQLYPSVALSNRGEFVIGWQSTFPDASGDIVARVSGPRAQPMFVDAHAGSGTSSNLNGVLEPGETVQLEPRYRDLLTFPISLTGTASNLTGPPGPTYTLNDSTADYGTIAAGGGTNDCFPATGNCYVVTVSGARPAAHWDATFDELLSTGITKTWTLHVGESFPDVPTSQQFYAFIENLFHNGITGGCGGGNYCPTGSVTRGQMAVFLLKSEHDAFYTPPACTGVFPDVPCPSQFADWIEQLFAEGITGGCGGGNYCPDNPVTRAQMAVFLLKAEHGSSYVPPACTGIFMDVPCPSQFANWIEQLFNEQITGGCGGGNYCPNSPNNRGQMAVFLDKTFGFALYAP